MNRHAVSPLLLLALTIQVPSIDGGFAEAWRAAALVARNGYGAPRGRTYSPDNWPSFTVSLSVAAYCSNRRFRVSPSSRPGAEISRRSPLKSVPRTDDPSATISNGNGTSDVVGTDHGVPTAGQRCRTALCSHTRGAHQRDHAHHSHSRELTQPHDAAPCRQARPALPPDLHPPAPKRKSPGALLRLRALNCETCSCGLLGHDPRRHSTACGGLFSEATTRAGEDREHDGCSIT